MKTITKLLAPLLVGVAAVSGSISANAAQATCYATATEKGCKTATIGANKAQHFVRINVRPAWFTGFWGPWRVTDVPSNINVASGPSGWGTGVSQTIFGLYGNYYLYASTDVRGIVTNPGIRANISNE